MSLVSLQPLKKKGFVLNEARLNAQKAVRAHPGTLRSSFANYFSVTSATKEEQLCLLIELRSVDRKAVQADLGSLDTLSVLTFFSVHLSTKESCFITD